MEKLNNKNFDEKIATDKLTLVDFSATWCGPCKMFKPIIEQLEENMPEVNFFNADIDDCDEIAKRFRIFSVPTLILFKNGEKVDLSVGLLSYDDLELFVKKNI